MKILSKFVSYIFHPLLFPLYGAMLILFTNPNMFGRFGDKLSMVWLIIVFALTFVFPVLWLAMMRGLNMIDNFELQSSKDRMIPFIATATFYLWAAWMFKPGTNMKIPSNVFIFYMLLGSCFSIFIAFIINVYSKISLHALGVGSLFGLALILVKYSTYDLRYMLILIIVLGGIIGTARLILSAHSVRELTMGYLAGFTAQFISFIIIPRFL